MPISKIAIIGDSVAWGQGLVPSNKYVYKVAAGLNVNPQDVCLQAHSGAEIGVGHSTDPGTQSGEVPLSCPTILSQLDQIANPDTYDLLLINGGGNDVGFQNIFNPMSDLNDLHRKTWKACHDDMK